MDRRRAGESQERTQKDSRENESGIAKPSRAILLQRWECLTRRELRGQRVERAFSDLSDLIHKPVLLFSADARHLRNVSSIHLPFFRTFRRVQLGSSADFDSKLSELVQREFPDIEFEHSMSVPNLEAVYHDFKKNSVDWKYVTPLDSFARDRAIEHVVRLLGPAVPVRLAPISLAEALYRVDYSTSPGWPLSTLIGPTKGDVIADPVIDWHEAELQLTQPDPVTGRPRLSIWSISGKEEVRPTLKLSDSGVRSFMPTDMFVGVLGLRASYNLTQAISNNWRSIPITFGMPLQKGCWDFNVRSMTYDVWGCDAVYFDGSIDPEMLCVAAYIHSLLMTDESLPLLDSLLQAILEGCVVMPDGTVVWRSGGMPSGAPITILWNSFMRLFQLLYPLCKLGLSDEEIKTKFECNVHGDDSKHGCHPSIVHLCSPDSLNKVWLAEGRRTFFDADNEIPFPASQVGYLSHHSVLHPCGKYLPVRSRSKVLTSAVCGALTLPDGWHPRAHNMSRLWQLTNEVYPDFPFWQRMVKVALAYEKYYESEVQNLDPKNWIIAKKQRKSEAELYVHWTGQGISTWREPRSL